MNQKLIMENWRRFIDEQRVPSVLSELEEDIIEEEKLLEGWLQQALAGGALALGMMGAPNTAQADNSTIPSGEETTQQAVKVEVNAFHVLLGMLDLYIDGKPLEDKHDANMEWSSILSALDGASDGDAAALDNLTGKDVKLLKLLEKHVEKNSGDKELVNYWGKHGTTIDIQFNTNY